MRRKGRAKHWVDRLAGAGIGVAVGVIGVSHVIDEGRPAAETIGAAADYYCRLPGKARVGWFEAANDRSGEALIWIACQNDPLYDAINEMALERLYPDGATRE